MAFPTAGPGVKTLVLIHVVAYVGYLILLRMGVTFAATDLALVPRQVLAQGHIWQIATGVLLHAPTDVGHLLFNMLFLWWFGSPIEGWWGRRGLYRAYIVSALGGVLLTLLAGLAVLPLGPSSGLYHLWTVSTLGASGATLGLTVCWGAVLWNEELNFMFVGRMKVKTFIFVLVGIQLLTALSFDGTSSTSHLGGIAAGFLYGRGWFRPGFIKNWLAHRRVVSKQAQRERQRGRFDVIEGGLTGEKSGEKSGEKTGKDDVVGRPLWGPGLDDDEPVIH